MLRQHGAEVPLLPDGAVWSTLRALPAPVKVRARTLGDY